MVHLLGLEEEVREELEHPDHLHLHPMLVQLLEVPQLQLDQMFNQLQFNQLQVMQVPSQLTQ